MFQNESGREQVQLAHSHAIEEANGCAAIPVTIMFQNAHN
jgi:hypothetical protein